MDKSIIVNNFNEVVDLLRNTECRPNQKFALFQRITECIVSPVMAAHINYDTYCSRAVNILLMFCEDLDSVVRISAEENLNKIFRVLEKTKVSRILLDLYGEIKRNGNQRSLRICLKIFGYYAPQIREHRVVWYAQGLLPYMKEISKRKETLLQETFSEFVLKFGQHVQQGLTDSETCKLFEAFIENIGSDCAVKRRCTAQNCIILIEHACNKPLMAAYALNKVLYMLLSDHKTNTIIGILGFWRQLMFILIKGNSLDAKDNDEISISSHRSTSLINAEDYRHVLEIYDYCLYLVSITPLTQHSIINAALEVIHSMLQCLEGLTSRDNKNNPHLPQLLLQLMNDKNLKHVKYLRRKGTIKQRIFNLLCFEDEHSKSDAASDNNSTSQDQTTSQTSSDDIILQTQNTDVNLTKAAALTEQQIKWHTARSISECVDIDYDDEQQVDDNDDDDNNEEEENEDEDEDEDDFTTFSEMNDSQHTHVSTSSLVTTTANIEFTTKTNSTLSSGSVVIDETISGQGMVEEMVNSPQPDTTEYTTIDDAQNLLSNFSTYSDDEKSNLLLNTDNESISSIESKSEISKGLVVDGSVEEENMQEEEEAAAAAAAATIEANANNTKANNDAFTSFFSNINAASESVTKLFRSSATATTTAKDTVVAPATNLSSSNTMDSVSLDSNVSSLKRTDTEIIDESSSPDTSKTFPTPSTAIMGEIRSLDSVDSNASTKDVKQQVMDEKNDIPKRNARNPFLSPNSPLQGQETTDLNRFNAEIGTIYEQSLIYYTARLISARFLLNGCSRSGLYDDATIRVSIKSISLNIIAQCVRVCPEILEITLKYMESEKQSIHHLQVSEQETTDISKSHSSLTLCSDSSSKIDHHYEDIDAVVAPASLPAATELKRKPSLTYLEVFPCDDVGEPLLKIVDDHFGKSVRDYNFSQRRPQRQPQSPSSSSSLMTRSDDKILYEIPAERVKKSPLLKIKEFLKKSEVISGEKKWKGHIEITTAEEDRPPADRAPAKPPLPSPPPLPPFGKPPPRPPKPPKRTKSIRKSKKEAMLMQTKLTYQNIEAPNVLQCLYEVLFYYNHDDPILRAGVQNIIGHYIHSTQAGLCGNLKVQLQYLLAILCMGLQDEIHTVVVQALNTFDKIFPYVLLKYMSAPISSSCCPKEQHKVAACNCRNNQQQQHEKFAKDEKLFGTTGHFRDNDEIIDALLKAFQMQTKFNNDQSSSQPLRSSAEPHNIKMDCTQHHHHEKLVVSSLSCCGNSNNKNKFLFILPKLLLSKLRLCHYNKYWLVQNKYAEVISNLNYASLRSYYENKYTNSMNTRNHNSHIISVCNCCSSCSCCSSSNSTSTCFGCCHSCSCCSCSNFWSYMYDEDDTDNIDFVCNLENSFIDELLQLIGEDDVRVREHASKCLCNFILQNAKHMNIKQEQHNDLQQKKISFDFNDDKTYLQNLKLLINFLDYSIFNGMSPTLRNLLNPLAEQQTAADNFTTNFDATTMMGSSAPSLSATAALSLNSDLPKKEDIELVLGKVLYRLTNRLMSFKDKNMQFGIISCIKYLLKYFSFADYSCAWIEFNFMEIFLKLSQYNYNTAVDLTCQSDLIDVSSKLIVGSLLFQADVEANRDANLSLLKHIIKILNIYYYVFTNEKPLIVGKGPKTDLFIYTKELAITQNIGYFGNEQIYMTLYQILKSSYDNYKITINEEAGSKLISFLKTSLNALSACIEMLTHEAAAIVNSSGCAGSAGVIGSSSNLGKIATDINVLPAGGGTSSPSTLTKKTKQTTTTKMETSVAATETLSLSVLKLIEESLQYLTKVLNYAPEESIACLRQLLKYTFAKNYGNRQHYQQQQLQQQQQPNIKQAFYTETFMKTYFKAKFKELYGISIVIKQDDSIAAVAASIAQCYAQQTIPSSPSVSSSSFRSMLAKAYQQSHSTTTKRAQFSTRRGTRASSVLTDDSFTSSSIASSSVGIDSISNDNSSHGAVVVDSLDDNLLLANLFASGLEFHTWKSGHESEACKHIKLFEPLVIYCLTTFLKCNGKIQSEILELLVLLFDLNVTYSILDSKHVIFENIMKTLEAIENGVVRNALFMIKPIIKFLIKLSSKSDRSLITIPKIISIINNLLANCNVRDVAVQALITLSYEIFLMTNKTTETTTSELDISMATTELEQLNISPKAGEQNYPLTDPNALTKNLSALNNELDTQREVILGMLEKFIESNDCQQVLSLLFLIEQLQKKLLNEANKTTTAESATVTGTIIIDSMGRATIGDDSCVNKQQKQNFTARLPNIDKACYMICQSIYSNRICIQDWNDFYRLDTFFYNNNKYVISNSKEFMALIKHLLEVDATNFSDLSYATIILSNVIFKTEEIYLANHIKLYLKNHPEQAEKFRQKQAKQQQTSRETQAADVPSHSRLLDSQPTTSKAAMAMALLSLSSSISEMNYFANMLCDVLLDCLHNILSNHCHRSPHIKRTPNDSSTSTSSSSTTSTNTFSQHYIIQYCRLVCHFVKVIYQLCFNSRIEDSLLASVRSTLNACESKLLNEYYNLLMMYSTQGCPTSLTTTFTSSTTTATTPTTAMTTLAEFDVDNSLLQLQLELYNLLNDVGILNPLALLQRLQLDDISNHVRRALLNKVCHQSHPSPIKWNPQQVQHLFDGKFLNILIIEQFAFMCYLCEVVDENCSLFQTMVLKNIKVFNKHSIVYLLRLVEYLCKERVDCSLLCFVKFLQILNKLYKLLVLAEVKPEATALQSEGLLSSNRPLQLQIERLVRRLIAYASAIHEKNAIYDTFISLIEKEGPEEKQHIVDIKQRTSSSTLSSKSANLSDQLQFIILNDLENSCDIRDVDSMKASARSFSNIVDEKWIFKQLIKFSTQNNYDPQQIVKILLEIQSETKLQTIFNNGSFDATRLLRHSIANSLQAMLQTFRNNCIQHNPHINYMQPNPLARVALTQLMTRIVKMMQQQQPNLSGCAINVKRGAASCGSKNNNNTGKNKQQATVAVKGNKNTIDDICHGRSNTSVCATASGGDSVAGGIGGIDNIIYHTNIASTLLPIIPTIVTDIRAINTTIHLCEAVIALMESIKQIEVTALIYIESKFIDKFLSEHLLRPEHVMTLVRFIGYCCQCIKAIFNNNRPLPVLSSTRVPLTHEERNCITVSLQCIDILLHQKFIWYALNQQQQTFVKTMPTTRGGVGSSAAPDTAIDSFLPLTKCELNKIICSLLDVVVLSGSLLLENTMFYSKYRNALRSSTNKKQMSDKSYENEAWLTAEYNPKVIFLGKLIETKIGNNDKGIYFGGAAATSFATSNTDIIDLQGINNEFDFISLPTLLSISISSLRFNLFYVLAITPIEIIEQQRRSRSTSLSPSKYALNQSQTTSQSSSSMLPIIPIENLSDVDILKSFAKRLSIFGFTSRQQFEEYFMTFLLLINKVYDENMVDKQEQFQIRSICLEAIMELLITYKTFPIVGNKLSLYHHTTRWNRINCDNISLKKLHEIQLIISPSNVFYHSNLERNLVCDSVIGTQNFAANQFDLNFIWQQLDNTTSSATSSSLSRNTSQDEGDDSSSSMAGAAESFRRTSTAMHLVGAAAKTAFRNYQHFTKQSGIDYKSSLQLIFDVLIQMIEQNHILILPNLVKFTEICESREQIKKICEKVEYLKSQIPSSDTISHQHLIYLLCKTRSILIPSHVEMSNLESLIKNYLKSSHLFLRFAILNGLLSLLESYAKTNRAIGKLSDELARLKDIVLAYIDKHGVIEKSALACSDVHTKLIWTLNYCLMEWTSKLDPHCNLAFHTKLSVTKLLKNSSNEQVYLCCLHGLERMIVLDNKMNSRSGYAASSSTSTSSSGGAGGGGVTSIHQGADNQNQMLRPSIEKVALELVKLENEKFSIPALKLLLSCIYMGSRGQLENTELSNGVVQDDPEIIAQQTDKVDVLLQCIKTATKETAWIYGKILCQMIRDLVPPKDILTKVIKELLAINQPHSDVIAVIVFQVFRSAIDSSFLPQLQEWLTCSLPTFLASPENKAVWSLSVVFLSASINIHLTKLFPLLLSGIATMPAPLIKESPPSSAASVRGIKELSPGLLERRSCEQLGQHEITLFVTSAQDFYAKLHAEQKLRFREAFKEFHHIKVYDKMLQSL